MSIYERRGYFSDGGYGYDVDIDFNAHNANAIYGNSDTVQPPAVKLLYCIKY